MTPPPLFKSHPTAWPIGVLSVATPTRTFGVLMSAEPALAALSGLVFLGERLTAIQWAAIASIMIASGGSAATSGPTLPPLKD